MNEDQTPFQANAPENDKAKLAPGAHPAPPKASGQPTPQPAKAMPAPSPAKR